jgi:hypothetical protein
MTTPFSQGSAEPYPDSFWGSFKSDFVVCFPLLFVFFPIVVTIISAITATIEKGAHNITREWTGVWLMCTRFIPYYLFLPTMIAWFGAYAIARSSDLKWGNRPDSTESSGDVIATGRILVGLGVAANCILAVLSIYMTNNQTCTRIKYLRVCVFLHNTNVSLCGYCVLTSCCVFVLCLCFVGFCMLQTSR